MNRIKKGIIYLYRWLIFACNLKPRMFGDSPENILKIIDKFVALESPHYPNSLYLSRSSIKSAELLSSLISTYLETKSEVTLEQIFTVLKDEFILRGNKHGRK